MNIYVGESFGAKDEKKVKQKDIYCYRFGDMELEGFDCKKMW